MVNGVARSPKKNGKKIPNDLDLELWTPKIPTHVPVPLQPKSAPPLPPTVGRAGELAVLHFRYLQQLSYSVLYLSDLISLFLIYVLRLKKQLRIEHFRPTLNHMVVTSARIACLFFIKCFSLI